MPKADFKFDKDWLFKRVREDFGDLWDEFNENDKHVLASILKDQAEIARQGIIKGPEWFEKMNRHIAAQYANLSQPLVEKAKSVVFRRVGEAVTQIGVGILKGLT